MADCELISGCIFFNSQMANMPGTAEIYKTTYCKGKHDECARQLVFKAVGKEHVPKDLFPNQAERAQRIISEK
ncbi:MAG: hypothetical protein A2X56_02805 [Nitrospirae bacterium GWC2_57_13]|jgi:hypothetical protein|nr:MAG: hypothetical protein A2072_06865 [Nitrospirae bacterium GWC1_57_7]OGW28329.1 MAG: hypothetical protein A2X56_02805 [Nitrospirae bacterium GWC2_57_13]OGW40674.1 MAG: hypothetical protein A2X57_03680 [Nitrospirae bacterium GWD2_57_8]HAR45076.1 hypothetical protein [Nitrospiraceae bacterium]HAS55281.1 hypothetical protein [Nitrospiraceae bacterium]